MVVERRSSVYHIRHTLEIEVKNSLIHIFVRIYFFVFHTFVQSADLRVYIHVTIVIGESKETCS